MSSNLQKRVDDVALKLGVKPKASDDRPTPVELWLWKLEDSVKSIVKYPHRLNRVKPEGNDYDHHFLYAHRDVLKTEEDVEAASDDVLLEALGLDSVEHWGWLQFMVRDFGWYELLAGNWGLPCMECDFGGRASQDLERADDSERHARAALYFLDLMRERGVDPLGKLRERASAFKAEHQMGEEEFIEHLRQNDEWAFFVYTCESVVVRPEAQSDGGKVLYSGDFQAQFLHKIRNAARWRRRLVRQLRTKKG